MQEPVEKDDVEDELELLGITDVVVVRSLCPKEMAAWSHKHLRAAPCYVSLFGVLASNMLHMS